MAWLDRIFGRSQKAIGAITQLVGMAEPNWMERSPRAYAKEGYSINVVVYRCVDIVAKAMGQIPLMIVDPEGKEVYVSGLTELLVQPNKHQGWSSFVATSVAWRLITGTSYLEAVKDGASVPRELIAWSPFCIRPVVVKNERSCRSILRGWKYEDGGDRTFWERDPITGHADLLSWRTFNPMNEYIGMSPLEAAAWSVDQHNASSEWNKSMLSNAATPSGALASSGTLTDGQFNRLKEQMNNEQSGPANARNHMILEGGLTWQQFSLSPVDMDWLAGRHGAAAEVAAAYGVPLQVIPLPGEQTFANYEQARLSLIEDVVLPLNDDLLDELNRWLVPMFTKKGQHAAPYKIVPDLDGIPALAARRREKWDTVSGADFLTINEKREAVGYDPVPEAEADQIWVPAGKLPLNLDVTMTEEQMVQQMLPIHGEAKARQVAAEILARGD